MGRCVGSVVGSRVGRFRLRDTVLEYEKGASLGALEGASVGRNVVGPPKFTPVSMTLKSMSRPTVGFGL